MIKKTGIAALVICCTVFLALTACSKSAGEKQWGAVCHIYVDNLPQEYSMISQNLRDNLEIYLSLNNASANKKYSISLTEKNGYEEKVPMLPGTYSVSAVYITNKSVAMFEGETQLQSVVLKKDSQTDLPISIINPQGFVELIHKNEPSQEILSENIYSRKVQYAGAIIDLKSIRQIMQFAGDESKRLSPGETYDIPSTSHSGVRMIVQNTTDVMIPADQGDCVGIRFSNINAVFPKGIRIGTSITGLANAQNGLLGTPDYCLGSPFIGMGIGNATLVYLDSESGDRISFEINPSDTFVSTISYEFEKYQ